MKRVLKIFNIIVLLIASFFLNACKTKETLKPIQIVQQALDNVRNLSQKHTSEKIEMNFPGSKSLSYDLTSIKTNLGYDYCIETPTETFYYLNQILYTKTNDQYTNTADNIYIQYLSINNNQIDLSQFEHEIYQLKISTNLTKYNVIMNPVAITSILGNELSDMISNYGGSFENLEMIMNVDLKQKLYTNLAIKIGVKFEYMDYSVVIPLNIVTALNKYDTNIKINIPPELLTYINEK